MLERTLVVAIGDHGESLGEHGEEDHGAVPLRLGAPHSLDHASPRPLNAGEPSSANRCGPIDLMPTVLDAVGVAAVPRLDGESVLGVVRGQPRATPPLSYAETWYPKLHFGWSELRSARVGEWKLS